MVHKKTLIIEKATTNLKQVYYKYTSNYYEYLVRDKFILKLFTEYHTKALVKMLCKRALLFIQYNYHLLASCNYLLLGGTVGGSTGPDPRGIHDDNSDDGVSDNVPLPVPPQDLPLRSLSPSHAQLLRLHIRDHLVGHRPQLDCILCCFSCESYCNNIVHHTYPHIIFVASN